jgi:hypothetical protein
MVSAKLLELENSIQNLSSEEKLWLVEKIIQQIRGISQADNPIPTAVDHQNNPTPQPIWEIVQEIGATVPESEWEKVPKDLSKNFDLYQGSLE